MDHYRGPRRSPPPRDRGPMRDRDDHPDVEYFGKGESYRPGGSTGDGPYRPPRDGRDTRDARDTRDFRPNNDSWNADRRDDRRRDDIDSYIPPTSSRAQRPRSRSPGGFRRRSRSPFARGDRPELFPERTRSPPRRFSPRRNDRPRSPPRRRSRSPFGGRPRSPSGKRSREYTPDGRRSPKRERLSSPRGRFDRPRSPIRRLYSPARHSPRQGYRPRSRTPPPRDDRRTTQADDNWRRRSPSLRPSRPDSNSTSRRSSPPLNPDRASIPGSAPRSPPYRSANDSREPLAYRGRSPPLRRDQPEQSREPSAAAPEREMMDAPPLAPPTGPASLRNGSYDRPPPTGPSRGYNPPPQVSPPTGPAASQPSMSAHNRAPGPVVGAPTRPRGAPPSRYDGPPRDFTSPPMRGRGSLTYRAPSLRGTSYSETPPLGPRASSFTSTREGGIPTGPAAGLGRGGGDVPRGGSYSVTFNNPSSGYGGRGQDVPSLSSSFSTPPFRSSNNSSSTTYPRTQRFNTTIVTSSSSIAPSSTTPNTVNTPILTPQTPLQSHLSTLEKVVPGGKKFPSSSEHDRRIKMLEAEAERLRLDIVEKQRLKRDALGEWEIRERESERDALRSDLAQAHLDKLQQQSGQGDDSERSGGGMAF